MGSQSSSTAHSSMGALPPTPPVPPAPVELAPPASGAPAAPLAAPPAASLPPTPSLPPLAEPPLLPDVFVMVVVDDTGVPEVAPPLDEIPPAPPALLASLLESELVAWAQAPPIAAAPVSQRRIGTVFIEAVIFQAQ